MRASQTLPLLHQYGKTLFTTEKKYTIYVTINLESETKLDHETNRSLHGQRLMRMSMHTNSFFICKFQKTHAIIFININLYKMQNVYIDSSIVDILPWLCLLLASLMTCQLCLI